MPRTALLSLGLSAVLLTGCTIPTAEDRERAGQQTGSGSSTSQLTDPQPTAPQPTAGVPEGQGPATISTQQAAALQRAWNDFVDQHKGARLSMTLLPVGAQQGTTPLELGTSPALAGAETLRVAIALAAIQKSGADGDVGGDLITTLNAGDAKAAARLWKSLGTDREAAALTTRALRQAGDTTTQVKSANPLQSMWRPINQVRFTAGLACLPAAEYIRSSMFAADPEQQFGFGSYEEAQLSNGCVTVDGATTVRQMAILNMGAAGFVAVAMTARAQSGKKAAAQELLTAMAQWLMRQKATVPAGRCP